MSANGTDTTRNLQRTPDRAPIERAGTVAQYALAQAAMTRIGQPIRGGKASSVRTRQKTCCACAARFTSSTRWRAWAPSACGIFCTPIPYINALGAMTGNQAVQQVQAGLKAIYVSGWQVAADANNAGTMYPDQSLYPADSVPNLCRRINQRAAARRPGASRRGQSGAGADWFAPLVADAEAGFGGTLNAFELMKGMIEAGAACVHFEDQLSSAKKCGHLGGKVLVSTTEAIQKLVAARLAADVMGVPTLIMARTDADSAHLLTSDIDRARPRVLHRRAHVGRLLPHSRRNRLGHRSRAGLCARTRT